MIARALGIIVGLLVLASLLWIGVEMRYRNCVEAAAVSFPLELPDPNPYAGIAGDKPNPVTADPAPRRRAVRDCSGL